MKMQFSQADKGRTAYVEIDGKWIKGTIHYYIGETELNPGRELVEVSLRGYGLEVFDAEYLKPIPSNDSAPTERQMAYLIDLGYVGGPLTKSQASAEIDRLKNSVGSCHYCGMPANSWGFFDEPVCRECGG